MEAVVELLHKDQVNKRGAQGFTPLLLAAMAGHSEIAELLIRKGADVELRLDGESGTTSALMLAAMNGHYQVVEVLIAAGAGVDAVHNPKNLATALMMASANGHEDAVEVLAAKGKGKEQADEL
jgi:ankyrin repeat protein